MNNVATCALAPSSQKCASYRHSVPPTRRIDAAADGIIQAVLDLGDRMATASRRRRAFKRTVAELESLEDYRLADIGIDRARIREVAIAAVDRNRAPNRERWP